MRNHEITKNLRLLASSRHRIILVAASLELSGASKILGESILSTRNVVKCVSKDAGWPNKPHLSIRLRYTPATQDATLKKLT